jgi:hypothetical protein
VRFNFCTDGRIAIGVHLPPLDGDQVKQRREVIAEDGLLLLSKATGGIMRRIHVLVMCRWELATQGKSNLADATVTEAAIRDCARSLL